MAQHICIMLENINSEDQEIKKEVNTQIHKHLSTIFVALGILTFATGFIINVYTIRRLNGSKK